MKDNEKNTTNQLVKEPEAVFMRTFSSKEEADHYNLLQNIRLSDMEKYSLFCRMVKIGKMLASAKVEK